MVLAAGPAVMPRSSKTERSVQTAEERRAWKAVRFLGRKAEFGGQFDPSIAVTAGQQLIALADRRLRQLDGEPS